MVTSTGCDFMTTKLRNQKTPARNTGQRFKKDLDRKTSKINLNVDHPPTINVSNLSVMTSTGLNLLKDIM